MVFIFLAYFQHIIRCRDLENGRCLGCLIHIAGLALLHKQNDRNIRGTQKYLGQYLQIISLQSF